MNLKTTDKTRVEIWLFYFCCVMNLEAVPKNIGWTIKKKKIVVKLDIMISPVECTEVSFSSHLVSEKS